MGQYQQRLDEFARGKELVRLSRPVRDRADSFCDACGSNQPRVLFALKETGSDRCYFVGRSCLQELARRGAILRRFGKERGQVAYEEEMRRRAQESENSKPAATMEKDPSSSPRSEPPDLDAEKSPIRPAFFMIQAFSITVLSSSPSQLLVRSVVLTGPEYDDNQ